MLKMNLEWEEQLFSHIQDWFVKHRLTRTNFIVDTLLFQVVQDYNE